MHNSFLSFSSIHKPDRTRQVIRSKDMHCYETWYTVAARKATYTWNTTNSEWPETTYRRHWESTYPPIITYTLSYKRGFYEN
jgi:hypothetical protein